MKPRRFLDLGCRSSPNALKALGVVVATALIVAGCSGSNQQAGAGSAQPSTSSAPSSSASTSPIGSRPIRSTAPSTGRTGVDGSASVRPGLTPPKSSGKPPSPTAASAQRMAIQSCQTWLSGSAQNASQGSVRLRKAARTAAKARSLDEHWKPLSIDMAFVSSLPITDNSQAAVAKARVGLMDIQSACAALGVLIPN